MVDDETERNLGAQPIAELMVQLGLSNHDLVVKSNARVTHKMVARACKGRRLTRHSQQLVLDALNAAAGASYRLADLFAYS